ncbi:unnamed protein product [Rotaria sp. Silwood1]|nr:unnamed protein product [Rotaria sp. Silwood1]CAF3853252.1 unnamed protein product [Rotaria sp. Silwood1]CAF4655858.1 unnamed protein product [Rotaria sp. Silwood1]CAF4864887.1 unnamed protein product [Rotaria sp. Silwood1]
MVVLLLFNEFDNMTVEQILDKTDMNYESFEQVLLSLLKSETLKCAGINGNTLNENLNQSGITENSVIEINQTFHSNKIMINLIKTTEPSAWNSIDSETIYIHQQMRIAN